MKVIKKINNNIAVAKDRNNRDVIVFGKGIGFGTLPYDLTDISKVERTFYDIDDKYYGLLNEIPHEVFDLTTRLLDAAKKNIVGELNPNLVFILADHINFSINRDRKNLNISMPYSYELEYENPELTKISKWMVKKINEKMNTHLSKGEVTSLTIHFINALEGTGQQEKEKSIERKVNKTVIHVTRIVEEFYGFSIDKNNFNYFRFKNHLKYFVQRKEKDEMFLDQNEKMYESMKKEYPDTYQCVEKINDFFKQEFSESCTNEELLYLMIHVNRMYMKEDCNRKGITPEK